MNQRIAPIFIIQIFVLCGLISEAQNYHCTKDKPPLVPGQSNFSDRKDLFKLSDSNNYDSVLIGGWCLPHDMPSGIEFRKNGTFCIGECGLPCKDQLSDSSKGTYTFSGTEGWLTFTNGHRQRFSLIMQQLDRAHLLHNPLDPSKPNDYRYMLAILNQQQGGYYNYIYYIP